MAFNTKKQWLQQQLDATKELLAISKNNELMRISLENRIRSLEADISACDEQELSAEAKISMWFSGDATYGSLGLRGSFMKETLNSVEGMVKSAAQKRILEYERANHCRADRPKGSFYVTALTSGSFGYEMTYKEDGQLFEDPLIIQSINDVMHIIEKTSSESLDIDELVEQQPIKLLSHLKDFYTTIKKNHSFLRMASGNMGFTLDRKHTNTGFENICAQDTTEQEVEIEGTFMGALVESGKFEYLDEENKLKHGRFSEDIEADDITLMVRQFTNCRCRMRLLKHVISSSNGKKRDVLELLSIRPMWNKPSAPTPVEE